MNNYGNLKYPRFLFNRVKELSVVTVPSWPVYQGLSQQTSPILVLIFHPLLLS